MDSQRRQLVDNVRIAIADKTTEEDILWTAVTLIDAFSDNFNWTGFYIFRDGILELGPFIGPPTDHVRIELDSGICGAAASQKKTVIVDDVQSDPRFLACSLTTRSEIVVPLLLGERVLGEIDIDSDHPANFTSLDREMLQEVAKVIVDRFQATGLVTP